MNKIKLTFFLLFTTLCFGQTYLLPNEEVIFSFQTKNGKKMVLAKDKENEYIIYRFGNSKKIELEYPSTKDKNSWNKFMYSYYHRGGGVQNSGMELNSLFFKNGNFEYVIYYDYHAEGEVYEAGILITDLIINKDLNIKGIYKSVEGDLHEIFNTGLIKEDKDRIR